MADPCKFCNTEHGWKKHGDHLWEIGEMFPHVAAAVGALDARLRLLESSQAATTAKRVPMRVRLRIVREVVASAFFPTTHYVVRARLRVCQGLRRLLRLDT